MSDETRWRLISDYIGAGQYVLTEDRAVVGTETGVQCVPRRKDGPDSWRAEFGSRCVGVRQTGDDTVLASCRGGLLELSLAGDERREKLFAEQLVAEAVPFHEGLLVAAGTTLAHYDSSWSASWRFDLRDALGQSVESIRMVNLFPCGGKVVAAAVDYDSGVGRVVVLDAAGKAVWMSEPGPVSEAFPAGPQSFVWCLTGYGKFETRCSQLNGQEVWLQNFAGMGTARSDGSVVMLVGSNESPQWDNWQYREIDPSGKLLAELDARGRAPVRPTIGPDDSVYFVGYVLHLDPTSSRVDYTNFFAMPQELCFQHLVGLRKQIPEYEVWVQKVSSDRDEAHPLLEIQGSFSLARPVIDDSDVVICDGRDLVAVEG